jgi:predicted metal-dependent hydrolase
MERRMPEIEIVRTNRKSMSLKIGSGGKLIFRVPANTDDGTIRKILAKNSGWIKKKINELAKERQLFRAKEYVNGEGFPYLGTYYKLKVVDKQDLPIKFDRGFFISNKALPEARELIINWYKDAARLKIPERVRWYAQKRRLSFNKVNITDSRKRLASCSPSGNLNFSWRLIMAPLGVIDYAVVHELIHLVEKNHTKEFWAKIKLMLPDYEKYKEWLKKNGYLLDI